MNLTLTPAQHRFLWWLLASVIAIRAVTLALYPLLDPSESRYAEIARKMVETGNWLVPQFDYGVPFWGKPPLAFWLSAAAMWAFGVNEFAARLPSLLLMAGCGALLYPLARAHAGRAAALLTLVVFATTGLVFIAGGAVLTDPALTFGTTLAMTAFWRATQGPAAGRRAAGYAFFAGLALGLLAKGPIAVVLTVMPLGLWILWQREWRAVWTHLPWLSGLLLVAVLVLPWYWAVERATPGFLDYFVIGEHWKRFTEPGWTGDRYGVAHAWKRGWIWLFFVLAAVPWSVVVLDWLVRLAFAPRERLRHRLADPLFRYVLLWTLCPLLFFTTSGNVLPTYVLPALPAFALAVAVFGPAAAGDARTLDRAEKRGLAACVVLLAVFVGVLVAGHARIDRDFAQRALVRAYQAQRTDPGQRLVYLGDEPVSAEFYTHGKAQRVADATALAPYLADAPADFYAMREEDLARLPAADRARLAPVADYGRFRLFRETAAAAAPAEGSPR